jgi:hypothetical protein
MQAPLRREKVFVHIHNFMRGGLVKKLMLAVMLAMIIVATAPTLAQSDPVGPDASKGGPPSEGPGADSFPGGPPSADPSPPDESPGTDAPASEPPSEDSPEPPVIGADEVAPSGGPSSDGPDIDTLPVGGPPNEGPGADTPASGPIDEGLESPSSPVDPDTLISGGPSEGSEAPLSCEVLKAVGADMGCDLAPNLDEVGGQEADPENLESGVWHKRADRSDPKAEARDKTIDRSDRELGDEEEEDGSDLEQDLDQEADSGNADQSVNIINTGDNVNMCIGVLQNANTGNSQNQEGAVQDDSEAEDIELGDGSSITVTPQLVVDCRQVILQVAAAAQQADQQADRQADRKEPAKITPGAVVLKNVEPALAKTGSASVLGQPLVGQSAAVLKGLPKTGGISIGSYAVLLGLGAGSLLIAIGLLARRVLR